MKEKQKKVFICIVDPALTTGYHRVMASKHISLNRFLEKLIKRNHRDRISMEEENWLMAENLIRIIFIFAF